VCVGGGCGKPFHHHTARCHLLTTTAAAATSLQTHASRNSGLLLRHARRVLGAAAEVLNKPGRPRVLKAVREVSLSPCSTRVGGGGCVVLCRAASGKGRCLGGRACARLREVS
jgi:hypothetical protein